MKTLEELKLELIIERIIHFEGNRTRAAKSLGIAIRTLTKVVAEIKLNDPETYAKIPARYGQVKKETSWPAWKRQREKLKSQT